MARSQSQAALWLGTACLLMLAMFPIVYHMGYRHAEERHHDMQIDQNDQRQVTAIGRQPGSLQDSILGDDDVRKRAVAALNGPEDAHFVPREPVGEDQDDADVEEGDDDDDDGGTEDGELIEENEPIRLVPAKEQPPKKPSKQQQPPEQPSKQQQPPKQQELPKQQPAPAPAPAAPAVIADLPTSTAKLHLKYSPGTPWPQIPMINPNTMPSGVPMEDIDPDVVEPRSFVHDLPGVPVTNVTGVPSECKWVHVRDLPANKLPTSVRCRAGPHNRSCIFDNLYYGPRDFFSIEMPKHPLPTRDSYVTNRDGKYGYPWTPAVVPSATEEEARANIVKPKRPGTPPGLLIVCPDTQLYFHTQFAGNPGHGLWDGLYPAFMSAIRLGYGRAPLRMMPSLPEWKGPCQPGRTKGCQAKEIIEQFGGRGMIMLQHIMPLKAQGISIYFERMIVGSGRMAQRFLTADVSINGGRSLNGMRYFRDRMYWSHNMTYRDWQPKRSNEQVRAFLVDNKRYSKSDRENMDKAIAVAKTEGMTIKKMSWRDYWPFTKQLELMGSSDIYITGPGTGMMLSPFMPDQAVTLNLGDCFKRHDRIHPSAEEEYITEATPFMRGIYYDSHTRLQGLQVEGLLKVFREAFRLTREGFALPVPTRINLSAEGRVFAEACDMAPGTCKQMLNEMNSIVPPWQCVVDAWASFAVYEIGGYIEGGMKKEGGKNGTCTMPRTEMRMLRKKYAAELGTNEVNKRQC